MSVASLVTAVVGTMTMLVLVTALSLSSVLMENQLLCKDNGQELSVHVLKECSRIT